MSTTQPSTLPETTVTVTCIAEGIPAVKEAIEQEIAAFNDWIVTNVEERPLHPLEHAILRTYLQLRLIAPMVPPAGQ